MTSPSMTPFSHLNQIEVKTLTTAVGDDEPVNEAIKDGWYLKSATVMPGVDWNRVTTVVYIFERTSQRKA